jgi:hypothetical protein
MIVNIRLMIDTNPSTWIAQSLLVLFDVLINSKIDDDEKILATDIIGRLAHIPSGTVQVLHHHHHHRTW